MASKKPTMKAVQWTSTSGGLEKNLKFTTAAATPPKADALPPNATLVKVAYASLNPVDYKLPEIPLIGSLLFSKPAIPGSDYSGTVISSTLPNLKPGQRVFGVSPIPTFGALAEHLIVPGNDAVIPLPDAVALDHASTIGVCAVTAYQAIAPFVRPGSKVFINGGSGGVGTYGIQIAKTLGCSVTATCSGPNVELCQSLGADQVIDYRSTDVIAHLTRQATQYDLLADFVGAPAIYFAAHHYLKPNGKYVTIAGEPSLQSIREVLSMFFLPSWLGGGRRTPKLVSLVNKAQDSAQIAQWIAEGKVKTVIEKIYAFEDTAEAYAKLKTGRTRGKIVVKVTGE